MKTLSFIMVLLMSVALAAESPATVMLDETDVIVEDSGLSHVTRHLKIRIDSEEGIKRFSHLRSDYDPATSAILIKLIRIIRENGEIVDIPMDTVLDLPQPQFMIYWGARMKLIDLPLLEIGDTLEVETYLKGFQIAYLGENDYEKYIPPMRGHYYDSVIFESDLPIEKKLYSLTLPVDKRLNAEIYNGELASRITYDDDSVTYAWWKENVPAVEKEPRMVSDRDACTKLVLATVKDWQEKSRWFFEVNENQFEPNEAIRSMVESVISGCSDDDCVFTELLHWVANNIRYSGISMGKGEGYTLHPGSMVFHNRCGVCKDIAGMLITMLRAAGYTVYPAMTMAGARVENVPADQFNHCVVAVERDDHSFTMLDPTWCPFSRELWSSAEANQNYVIGSPRGEILMETPHVEARHNLLRLSAEDRLSEEGSLEGVLTIAGNGYSETNLRWSVVYGEFLDVKNQFIRWLSGVSSAAVINKVEMTDVHDLSQPFTIRIDFMIPDYAWIADKAMAYTPLLAHYIVENRRLNDVFDSVKGEDRMYDVFLRSSRAFEFEEVTRIPAGYYLSVNLDDVSLDRPAAAFKRSVKIDRQTVRFTRELIVKKKIIPAEEHEGLKEVVEQFRGEDGLVLRLERNS